MYVDKIVRFNRFSPYFDTFLLRVVQLSQLYFLATVAAGYESFLQLVCSPSHTLNNPSS